jgi:hypothetical protein
VPGGEGELRTSGKTLKIHALVERPVTNIHLPGRSIDANQSSGGRNVANDILKVLMQFWPDLL